MSGALWVNLICALVTLLTVIFFSVKGKKMLKLIPFILGIIAGYLVALAFTLIGNATNNETPNLILFMRIHLSFMDVHKRTHKYFTKIKFSLLSTKYQNNIIFDIGIYK